MAVSTKKARFRIERLEERIAPGALCGVKGGSKGGGSRGGHSRGGSRGGNSHGNGKNPSHHAGGSHHGHSKVKGGSHCAPPPCCVTKDPCSCC